MTLDENISFWATVGTCLSALATFWTVIQMKRQRTDSFRPDLAFASAGFEAKPSRPEGKIPEHWTLRESMDKPLRNKRDFVVTLHNLGLGSARTILLEWSFPIEQVVREIKSLAEKRGVNGSIELQKGILFAKLDSLAYVTHMWEGQRKITLDFVLQAAVAAEPVTIQLPLVYVFLCSVQTYLAVQLPPKSARGVDFPELPPLTAKIEYLDIGGIKHRVTFDFNINLFVIEQDAASIMGHVQCKRHL